MQKFKWTFSTILTLSEEVLKDRPYPYMIDTLRRRHGIPNPGSVIKIGDTTMDILEGMTTDALIEQAL